MLLELSVSAISFFSYAYFSKLSQLSNLLSQFNKGRYTLWLKILFWSYDSIWNYQRLCGEVYESFKIFLELEWEGGAMGKFGPFNWNQAYPIL